MRNWFHFIEKLIALLKIRFERVINIAKLKFTRRQFIFFSAILVALSAGFASIILKLFVHYIFEFATHNRVSNYRFFYLLLPLIGITLTVIVIKKFYSGKINRGLSQIHFAVARKEGLMPKRSMFDQFFTSSLTVGFGGSTGLEAPIVITGAAVGSNFARTYHLTYNERTLLLACGIAAGIGAAFNAPIAGVLFAIEVLLVDIGISAFTILIIAAATGALVSKIILSEGILLNFNHSEPFNYTNVPFFILLGVLSGLMAVYHSRMFFGIDNILNKKIKRAGGRILLSGTILALMIAFFPPLFGEGYQSIKYLADFNSEHLFGNSIFFEQLKDNQIAILVFVGLLVFLKTIAAALTIGGGGNGGNFAPALFTGAYLGFFLSRIINYFSIADLPESNFTQVGMAGVLSGLYHAPLTSIFLIAELTGGYNLMIPLMIVSSISYAISKYYEPYSMDLKKLVKQGNSLTEDKDYNILSAINPTDYIESDVTKLLPEASIEEVIAIISNSKHNIYPVTEKNGKFVGVVLLEDIHKMIISTPENKKLLVMDVMKTPPGIIDFEDNMSKIMERFDDSGAWILPVIKDDIFIGFISKTNIFNGYRRRLKGSTIN